jgi:hypothetical protein
MITIFYCVHGLKSRFIKSQLGFCYEDEDDYTNKIVNVFDPSLHHPRFPAVAYERLFSR